MHVADLVFSIYSVKLINLSKYTEEYSAYYSVGFNTSFNGRAISSVPFKTSAVRLSGPQDFPVFKVSISFTISSISGGQNSERMDQTGRVGVVGRAPGGSVTKMKQSIPKRRQQFQHHLSVLFPGFLW